jgi:salicylate biosynthesis isochorismate synthase/menaquinone-specific isochorismate synthase
VADPCVAIFAARLASDRWFCWEQPDREFALAGMGVAREASGRGARRFDEVAREIGEAGRDSVIEAPR